MPDDWVRVQIRLQLRDPETSSKAAALLGPAQPFRPADGILTFAAARDGSAQGPEGVLRLLKRLDDSRIIGDLSLAGAARAEPRAVEEAVSIADSWDAALAALPADWSDLFAEVEFPSSDYIEPAAVLCIQMNPRRDGNRAAFRFRAARRAGYGVSPGMARRCFERCDEHGITGTVTVLRVLSDTHHVATQGPVWLAGGKTI